MGALRNIASARRIAIAIVAIGVACGVVLHLLAPRWRTPKEEADSLARSGEVVRAEERYWELVRSPELSVPLALAFFENHEHVRIATELRAAAPEGTLPKLSGSPTVKDADVEHWLQHHPMPESVRTILQFVWATRQGDKATNERAAVEALAKNEPPSRWANHVLGQDALLHARIDEAARAFIAEGLSNDAARDDVDLGLRLWMHADAWDKASAELARPDVRQHVSANVALDLAVHDRNWSLAALYFVRAVSPPLTPGPLLLTAICAVAWAAFAFRLGKVRARLRTRLSIHLAAFVLGFLSVYPTLAILLAEEATIGLRETGEPLRDALFFVFGVGLREELSKLLLFLPLIPILKRYGDRLDVIIAGAMVGLGFAAEENIGYLHHGDLSAVMARFLTANFLHMSMTGILALSLFDAWHDSERRSADFSQTLLMVVGLHGAYDFLLSSSWAAEFSFLAMAVFIVLARRFLHDVMSVRGQMDAGAEPIAIFTVGLAVVIASSYAYASYLVGPYDASIAIFSGLLGLAIILVLFLQELRRT